ncbi:hypothetical protein JZ751_004903 [Albula glossodonta]|uniref:Serine-threonine protein phosphatase N-terminal domain-containing protein n=1 Tax=Albula glossodonta TaxID=121402 RepID=A0A8T2P6Q6_9TELE|nr:hypothetical protein JZ751_004903 [Albula glossodonta]
MRGALGSENQEEQMRGCRPGKIVQMTEAEVRGLCIKSREIFLSQPILLELEAPLKICVSVFELRAKLSGRQHSDLICKRCSTLSLSLSVDQEATDCSMIFSLYRSRPVQIPSGLQCVHRASEYGWVTLECAERDVGSWHCERSALRPVSRAPQFQCGQTHPAKGGRNFSLPGFPPHSYSLFPLSSSLCLQPYSWAEITAVGLRAAVGAAAACLSLFRRLTIALFKPPSLPEEGRNILSAEEDGWLNKGVCAASRVTAVSAVGAPAHVPLQSGDESAEGK